MPTIDQVKQLEVPDTPLFLFDCVLSDGSTERWSTHGVAFNGNNYAPRIIRHNLFDLRDASDAGVDSAAKVTVTLANADSYFSQIERTTHFKGARVTVTFAFFDITTGQATTNSRVLFRGVANPVDEIAEATLRLSFSNRLNLQRVQLPEVRISRRCPWTFPATAAQRLEATDGGGKGKYNPLYRCGYSAGVTGGAGTMNGAQPFTACDYSRAQCEARGMFDKDSSGAATRRFGGIEFVPASILVRSFGEKGTHLSPVLGNEAKYNDYVPLVYGTAWCEPPVVLGRNDGNLTRFEVLLGAGEIATVLKVLVNDIEIPEGISGVDMNATGWYTLVTPGARNGAFNPNFTDGSGHPIGDPYGSMAMLSVVTPNRVQNGTSMPKIQVLMQGLKLPRYDTAGVSLGETFSANPAWVLLDVLRRSGWTAAEIDLPSFATTAAYCDQAVSTVDVHGNPTSIPRYSCNLVVQKPRSAAELVKGIRGNAALLLSYTSAGLLELRAEGALAVQQAAKPAGTNSTLALNGGWPAYEFSDGSDVYSGILRKANGEPALRLVSRPASDSPNRFSVEFQDEFNEYQQDSLSLVDSADASLSAQEVSAALPAAGLPNFDQATRMLALALDKSIHGNTFVEFETSVRGAGLRPGDIIAITYQKEGLVRQPFRILRLSPSENFETVLITAQWHDDMWYPAGGASTIGSGREAIALLRLPRPLVGTTLDADGIAQFSIAETAVQSADGSFAVRLSAGFVQPSKPAANGPRPPLVALSPSIQTTGGSLAGGTIYYYAVSGVDASGSEGSLSFSVKAKIPAGTNTNQVTLGTLSFSSTTTAFHVYRGASPSQLLRIASNLTPATSFTDSGSAAPQLIGPPDENYDHANFYWRFELQPPCVAGLHSPATVGNPTLDMLPNTFRDTTVRIMSGLGAGQERRVVSNTATTLTVTPAWTVEPDSTSKFTVADPSWQFGATSPSTPVEFEVPNRQGTTVQVSGRAANAHDLESAAELNPITRWQIGGAQGAVVDTDVPPQPTFGLYPAGQGTVQVLGIGFPSLTNTRTVAAGTVTLVYWDELSSPTQKSLAVAMTAAATTLTLNAAGPAQAGDYIQIDAEILRVEGTASGGGQYTVTRGWHGTTAAAHSQGAGVYHLQKSVHILPFAKDFFGSQSSGSYAYPIFLPDVRIAGAELFMTNVQGNSPVKRINFTSLTDQGLRTLSGGQYSIQVAGYLAIQNDAAPALVLEDTHAMRDAYAVLKSAPVGGSVQMQLRQGSTVFATLTIAAGQTVSNTAGGFGLAPLTAGSTVSLDVLSVPQAANSLPGADLTVVIRL